LQEVEEKLVEKVVHELKGGIRNQSCISGRNHTRLIIPRIGVGVMVIGNNLRGGRRGNEGCLW
jgi:hypothetical protein